MIKNPILIKTNAKIDKLSEKALKQFILEKIEDFLLELGYGRPAARADVPLKEEAKPPISLVVVLWLRGKSPR